VQIKPESGKEANGRTATNIVIVQAMGAPRPATGALGSSVIQKRVTDLLDVPSVVGNAIPNFAEAPA
jgi:hypothetical protein